MKKCRQCNSNLYHHICYNCGWDDALPFGIEKTHVERIIEIVEKKKYKGTKCEECNNGLYHQVCGSCGWDHKKQSFEGKKKPLKRMSDEDKFFLYNEYKNSGKKPKRKKNKLRQYTALSHPINNNYGVPEWAKARPSYNKTNNYVTPHEQILYDLLSDEGIIFEYEKAFENRDRLCTVDFYLETQSGNFVIEIDGSSHSKRKEANRTSWLIEEWGIQEVWRYRNPQLDNNPFLILEDIKALKPMYYDIPVMPQL